MSKIKLELKLMPVPRKIEFSRQIVLAMTGNANFSSPDPALAAITASIDDLETAYNHANAARQTAVTQTSIQADKENALDLLLSKLGNYIENASEGDEAKILSAGLSVRSKPTPVGPLQMPIGLHATAGDKEGEVDLGFEPVNGAKTYVAQKCLDPITADGWKSAGISTKSSITITGLVSGTKCWFRVAAVGTAGQGPWSDPVSKYVP